MRLLLTAACALALFCICLALLNNWLNQVPMWAATTLLTLIFIASLALAVWLCNLEPYRAHNGIDYQQQLDEWRAQGLIVATDYTAKRAFEVDESGDEGPHFFFELSDGSVLYLNGQYL